jgi:peptide deformylase
MSVPGVQGQVERRDKISFLCDSLQGESIRIRAEGFLARIFAHEIDHLNGILYLDRLVKGSQLEAAEYFTSKDYMSE